MSWWTTPEVQRDRDVFRREITRRLPEMTRPDEAEVRRITVNAHVAAQWQHKFTTKGGQDDDR
jgi:hypothetical protein